VEIKIKWIPRKQMTHENTYRDDNSIINDNAMSKSKKKTTKLSENSRNKCRSTVCGQKYCHM
jgi:hypothetical protein